MRWLLFILPLALLAQTQPMYTPPDYLVKETVRTLEICYSKDPVTLQALALRLLRQGYEYGLRLKQQRGEKNEYVGVKVLIVADLPDSKTPVAILAILDTNPRISSLGYSTLDLVLVNLATNELKTIR